MEGFLTRVKWFPLFAYDRVWHKRKSFSKSGPTSFIYLLNEMTASLWPAGSTDLESLMLVERDCSQMRPAVHGPKALL